jgi:hypothetical protein
MELWDTFAIKSGLGDPALRDVVLAICDIPYGRPRDRTPYGVVDEWRGTCSTKHVLLHDLVTEWWPHLAPELVHRAYRLNKPDALTMWSNEVAATIPAGGLIDVHTYMTVMLRDRPVIIDATFPVSHWDGISSMHVWAGPGKEVPAGPDPLASKADLLSRYCDPSIREPFIEAIAATTGAST